MRVSAVCDMFGAETLDLGIEEGRFGRAVRSVARRLVSSTPQEDVQGVAVFRSTGHGLFFFRG